MNHYETSYKSDAQGRGRQRLSERRARSSPKPAQKIPWSEIFRRHISQIQGHLKMTEMIKKHTVEQSANWDTICSLIDQTKEMLRNSEIQYGILVPQPSTRELGLHASSSPPAHSGYLPTKYERENAAGEYEKSASASRTQGVDPKSTQSDDALRQEARVKRPKLGDASLRTPVYESSSMNGTDSGSDGLVANSPRPRTVNVRDEGDIAKSDEAVSANGDATLGKKARPFVLEANSSPSNLAGLTKSPKRNSSPRDNKEGKKTKKAKTHHFDGEKSSPLEKIEVEFEDISQEVDARLKEKEEKRKRKKDKKRKKSADIASDVAAPDESTIFEGPERSKKKKKLKQNDDAPAEATEVKKRAGAETDEGQGERRKKKRKKNIEAKDN